MKNFMCFLILISCFSCQSSKKEWPKALEGFPTDTTIVRVKQLPAAIKECSGMIKWNDAIWMHNDSGNGSFLFEVDLANGSVKRKVHLKEIENKDWEALTQDADYLYIGDYGNNHGSRKDLRIFKIPKSEIELNKEPLTVETIRFSYPDQKDFTGPTHQHNYDCEAMIAVGDSLYLFSKNFQDKQTKLYALPKVAGNYTAHLKDRFNVKGNVTDAAITDEGLVALAGYYFQSGSFFPFIWLLWDYPEQSFFQGKQQRVNCQFQAQMEGICYDQNGHFLLSSEASRHGKQQVFRFNVAEWLSVGSQ